jgi:hypothetical protein
VDDFIMFQHPYCVLVEVEVCTTRVPPHGLL